MRTLPFAAAVLCAVLIVSALVPTSAEATIRFHSRRGVRVFAPGVRVFAPGVRVNVGRGVRVFAPGFRGVFGIAGRVQNRRDFRDIQRLRQLQDFQRFGQIQAIQDLQRFQDLRQLQFFQDDCRFR